jgi:hypothetical protein
MGFNIQKGGNFTLCPAGTHVARCYMVIDLGHQPVIFQGKVQKPRRKVRIGFEFPTLLHVFDEAKGKEPYTLSKAQALSYHEKASLRPMLNSWRGKPLTEEQLYGVFENGKKIKDPTFSIDKVLGAPAMVSVIHEKKADGSSVAKISSVTQLPAEIAGTPIVCPPAVIKPILFTVDDGPNEKFKTLPDWIRDECAKCVEWAGKPTGEPGAHAQAQDAGSAPEPNDDNSPF